MPTIEYHADCPSLASLPLTTQKVKKSFESNYGSIIPEVLLRYNARTPERTLINMSLTIAV
jgi:hypothetical protein